MDFYGFLHILTIPKTVVEGEHGYVLQTLAALQPNPPPEKHTPSHAVRRGVVLP